MAMLAGPRRKQKVINLRAKNNAWSEDTTKFGQRMLEKMGWSAGKGLGAKENGIVEHVVARYKNDDRGLGFEDRNDQWTKHEDDFNSLLANLSNGDSNKDDKLHSGVSLEVKSKTSKARVHYHKFTRGKDLTRYSEKDLANIFGKKTLKSENKPSTEETVENSAKKDEKDATPVDKVFTEGGSMEDYFKSKLAAMKSKNKLHIQNNATNDNENTDYSFRGFSGTMDKDDEEETHQGFGFQSFSLGNAEENEAVDNENNENLVESKKKKKKKRKHQDEEPVANEIVDDENVPTQPDSNVDEIQKSKKSKKKKKKDFEETVAEPVEPVEPVAEPVEPVENVDEAIITKKSKKKKNIDATTEHVAEDYVPKKKKKRKDKGTE